MFPWPSAGMMLLLQQKHERDNNLVERLKDDKYEEDE
jgi:hypothetical protein